MSSQNEFQAALYDGRDKLLCLWLDYVVTY